jgi:hypothetical protein
MMVTQLFKKFPAFYGTRSFITISKLPLNCVLRGEVLQHESVHERDKLLLYVNIYGESWLEAHT